MKSRHTLLGRYRVDHSERELIEFTKDSVRQILSPKWSKASIIAACCLIAFILIRFPIVKDRLPFLPKRPLSAFVCDIPLLASSAMFGFLAVRKKNARGRFIGAVCMIVSVSLLLRRLQQLL